MEKPLYNDITLGSYTPAFFYISVDLGVDLGKLESLSVGELAVFLHEYSHFLQDTMTVFGLRNILHIISVTKVTLLQVRGVDSTETINLPIKVLDDEITKINIDLKSYYVGDSECKIKFNKLKDHHENDVKLIDPETNDSIDEKYIELEVFHEYRPKEENEKIHFGVTAILEGMAFLIENAVDSSANPIWFPYRVVEFLVREIYPEVTWDRDILVALCEISLETYNPAARFIDILKKMREDAYIPQNTKDVYEFGERYTIENKTSLALYMELIEDVRTELHDIYQGEVLTPVRNWIDNLLDNCKNIKSKGFRFSDLIEGKTSQEVQTEFTNIIEQLGYPLLSNSKDKYWGDHPAQVAFKGIIETYALLRHYDYSSCSLYSFCASIENNNTCNSCLNAPWQRIREGKKCSLATLWKIWGINEKQFVKRRI